MKKIIHVAQDAIRRNMKTGSNDPVLIVREGSRSARHHEVELVLNDGTIIGKMEYSPHKPLSCGARLWISVDTTVCQIRPVGLQDADTPADGRRQTLSTD